MKPILRATLDVAEHSVSVRECSLILRALKSPCALLKKKSAATARREPNALKDTAISQPSLKS